MKKVIALILATVVATASVLAVEAGHIKSKAFKASNIFGDKPSAELYSATGRGMITNIQLIGAVGTDVSDANILWEGFYRTTMNVYVDGQKSIAGTIYELCGMGSKANAYNDFADLSYSTPLFSKLGRFSGIQFTMKIPYYQSIRIELVRHPDDVGKPQLMWGLVRETDIIDIDYGTVKVPYGARLKALAVNKTVKPGDELELMTSHRKGVYLGCNFDCVGTAFGWVEGCVRAYYGNSTTPVMLSSGFEDYVGFCFAFNQSTVQHPNFGATFVHMTSAPFHVCAFRQHFLDPIYFDKGGFRLTVRNSDQNFTGTSTVTSGEGLAGNQGDCDYTAIAFFYEWD